MIRLFLLTFTIITGCKTLYDIDEYSKNQATGSVSAQDYVYIYGYTDPEAKLPTGQEFMIILTPEKPKHACPDTKDKVGDAREVIITIDGKLGEMKVNPKGTRVEGTDEMFSYKKEVRSSSVAFLNPNLKKEDQYKFAKTGKIKITKKAPDMIEGLVLAKFDPDNFINGKFRAKICKWGQLN